MTEKLKITVGGADSFREPLTREWGLADVEAASIVRQGHAPSMASAMIGVGVVPDGDAEEAFRELIATLGGSPA
jgi:hypothetical protein